MHDSPLISSWIGRLPRNLLVWTIVCTISAAPSFLLGGSEHVGGMIAGVLIFIVGYTAIASTDFVARLKRAPFITRTLKIGYGIRIAQSLLSLGTPVIIVDMILGILSIGVVEGMLGLSEQSFLRSLLATLVQGALLNMVLFVLLGIIYVIQAFFYTPPVTLDPTRFCAACGYDLRASKDACPECGQVIPSVSEIAPADRRRVTPQRFDDSQS